MALEAAATSGWLKVSKPSCAAGVFTYVRRLPVLPNLRIASPCQADWGEMQGTSRVRSCTHCDKPVFNLSELTRAEAEDVIVAHAGKLCVRYFHRADGTILLADCTYHHDRGGWLPAIATAAAFGLAVVATTPSEDPSSLELVLGEATVGAIAESCPEPSAAVITVSAAGEITYRGQLVANVDGLFERLDAAQRGPTERMVVIDAHAGTDARVIHSITTSVERAGYFVLFAMRDD